MATFILKLASDPRGGLCGTLRRVASGETRPFADPTQLLACLAEWNALESVRAAGVKEFGETRATAEPDRPGPPGQKERRRQ